MAKAKTKSKSKFDIKQFLLAKGEYLAIGVAGFFLVVLLFMGISKWTSAKDPTDTVKALNDGAQRVQSGISSPTSLTDDQRQAAAVPDWAQKPYQFKSTPVSAFPLVGPPFDPTAKPDTKRENPNVLPIGFYQADLIRGAMQAFDMVDRGEEKLIGVIYDKKIEKQDKEKIDLMLLTFKGRKDTRPKRPMGGGQPPIGPGPTPGGPGRGGPGGRMGMGSMGGPGSSAYGGYGNFDTGAERVEKAIEYIPTTQLTEAIKKGKAPAMTVVPLRMVTIHAEIPLKRQIEEIRRALRLPSDSEAERWGPSYDGYNVRRKISRVGPDGKLEVIQDFADYEFEEKYRTLINNRKIGDNFDEGYLGHFVRYEMSLALPIPQMVSEVTNYPKIRLKNILETIAKLKAADKPPIEASELRKRILGDTKRNDLYRPLAPEDTGGGIFGSEGGLTTMPGGGGFSPRPQGVSMSTGGSGSKSGLPFDPSKKDSAYANKPVEIEHLMLRFVDVDVEPGLTYEYQIQLKMRNPNYKRTNEVSKPVDAEREFLDSPWVQLEDKITVPTETFLYAADWGAYHKKIKDEHGKELDLYNRLQVRENQAVVETCTWMEQVKTSDGGKREPIGAWVMADFAVGRGEYIGRKQYVKLPLWSSETKSYVLREIPDKVIQAKGGGPKNPPQPRGWLIDFTSNRSILVDYEGGKVRTKAGGRDVTEEAATEILVWRGDGKLVVKNSAADAADSNRKEILGGWEKWIKDVSARKEASSDTGGGFSPRPGGSGGPGGS